MNRITLLVVIGLAALPALAQTFSSVASTSNGAGAAITIGFDAPQRQMGPPITGQPYSAEQVTETVQTLADGTHIRQERPSQTTWRDSLGRVRIERSVGGGVGPMAGTKYVEISDPVGGYKYVLDDVNRIAHRITLEVRQPRQARIPRPAAASVAAKPPTGTPRPEFQNDDLGSQVIEGVTAHGTHMTQTWPVDSIGNDRPIVATHETWMAEQLRVTVLQKDDDPRYGESTTSLRNINLADPDPSLFAPPPGYQIVDETGPFKVTVARPAAAN